MNHQDRDILISRLIDGEAGSSDWAAFKVMAAEDPELWRSLAEAQRAQLVLSAGVEAELQIVDTIDGSTGEHAPVRLARRLRLVSTWGGWAVAAAATIVWATDARLAPPDSSGAPNQAGMGLLGSADALREAWLRRGAEEGSVVGEMPDKVLVQRIPAPSGDGHIVVYVRQIIEQAHVPSIYRFSEDEGGNLVPVRIETTRATSAPF